VTAATSVFDFLVSEIISLVKLSYARLTEFPKQIELTFLRFRMN